MGAFTDFHRISEAWPSGYRMRDDMAFEIGRLGSGMVYVVPNGFRFDVSIPRAARWLFNPHDYRYLKAAALHDHMLAEEWDAQTAAATFYRALRASRVPAWRAVVMYLAVAAWSLRHHDQAAPKA